MMVLMTKTIRLGLRAFSCMKRVKNYLKNNLPHTSLRIISIEKRGVKSLDVDKAINEFT